MPQVKKEDVRNAILEAAFALLTEKGYVGTTMLQIARKAGISNANIYIYFGSKLEVFFAVYEVWLQEKVLELEARVNAVTLPRDKLKTLVEGLLRDLPVADNGFTNNLIQAISTAGPNDPYNPGLANWLKSRLGEIVKTAMPKMERGRAARARFVHFLVMAFDGCAVNYRVNPASRLDEKTVNELTDMFFSDQL